MHNRERVEAGSGGVTPNGEYKVMALKVLYGPAMSATLDVCGHPVTKPETAVRTITVF